MFVNLLKSYLPDQEQVQVLTTYLLYLCNRLTEPVSGKSIFIINRQKVFDFVCLFMCTKVPFGTTGHCKQHMRLVQC